MSEERCRLAAPVLLALVLGLRVALPDVSAGVGLETFVACLPLAAILVLAALGGASGGLPRVPLKPLLPFVLLAAWYALDAWWRAPHAYEGWRATLHRASEASVVLLVLWAASRPSGRVKVGVVLAALGALAAAHALVQWVWIQPQVLEAFEANHLLERVAPRDQPELLSRMTTRRASGPFAIPNTLAGFLVLVLPLLLAGSGGGRARGLVRWGGAALVAAALAASGSKAGFLAAGLALGVLVWPRLGRGWRWGMLAAVGATLLLAVAIPAVREPLVRSASVRVGYWVTTLEVWRGAPVAGVGPGQLDHELFRRKPPETEETRHAHCDYLEVAAETGLVGLVLLLWAWVWPVARRPGGGPGQHDPPSRVEGGDRLLTGSLAALVVGVLAAVFLGGVLGGPGSAGAVRDYWLPLALCVPALLVGWGMGLAPPSRRALRAGLVGLLAHAAVDLHLHVAGLAALAAVWPGLLSAGKGEAPVLRPGRRAGILLALVALALLTLLMRCIAVPDLAADTGRPFFLEEAPGDQEQLTERLAQVAAARLENPLDGALPLYGARLCLDAALEDRTQGAAAVRLLELGDRLFREALELDPRNASARFEHAQLLESLAVLRRDRGLLELAVQEYRRAVEAYDAHPRYHLRLGLALEALGRPGEARDAYREALDRDARLYPLNRVRLGLSPEERGRAAGF